MPKHLAASFITSDAAIVSWSPAAGAKKYKLQYRTGTNPWISVDNILDTFYKLKDLAVHTKYSFKVKSVCGTGLSSAFSPTASFTTTFAYCAISGITDYEWIERVKLNTINNTSGNSHGYGDFTALSTSMAAGSLQKMVLTPGFTNNPDEEYWQVYIDYNQDGDFYDANELIGKVHGVDASNKNISFTVPATALNGKTRMRVVMNFDYYRNNPCETLGDYYGEVEDYTVKITGGTAVSIASASVKILNETSLLVVPNPVRSSSAKAILNIIKEGNASITITDLSGRILYRKDVANLYSGKNNITLNGLASLTNGTYFIEAKQNGIVIGRAQVVVAK